MGEPRPPAILAVDDDQAFLDELARLLEGKGLRPLCRRLAADSFIPAGVPIAAGVLGGFSPQGPDGFALCRELRRTRPDTPLILASTVFEQRIWRQEAASMGADCFFNKAWPVDLLVSDLRYALEGLRPTLSTGKVLAPDARKAVVADDDPEWRKLACMALELAGFLPFEADCGRRALLAAGRLQPDVVILDYMMPDYSGTECLEYLHKNPRTARVPVIIATDHPGVEVEETCLSLGAEDFVLKGRRAAVLLLRVVKRIRPRGPGLGGTVRLGPLLLDPRSRLLLADGQKPVRLSPAEQRLMCILMERGGAVASWEDVERGVHDGAALVGGVETSSVKQHVRRLRGKLGARFRDCLVARRGVGLQLDVTRAKK